MTTPFFSFVRPLAVVAFGGNALLRPEDPGTTAAQLARAREAVRDLLPVLARGYELVARHRSPGRQPAHPIGARRGADPAANARFLRGTDPGLARVPARARLCQRA